MKTPLIWRIRTGIYVIGIMAFIIVAAFKCTASLHEHLKGYEAQRNEYFDMEASHDYLSDEVPEFWPPDMIPHPIPPWEYPTDPDGWTIS